MIEDFSAGYYLTSMNIHEYPDGPSMDKHFYRFINSELSFNPDDPVMMRLGFDGGKTFSVQPENGIPRDVLALPPELFEEKGETNVFILKADHLDTVGGYYG